MRAWLLKWDLTSWHALGQRSEQLERQQSERKCEESRNKEKKRCKVLLSLLCASMRLCLGDSKRANDCIDRMQCADHGFDVEYNQAERYIRSGTDSKRI